MASPFERAFNPAFQQASAAAMKSLDDERQENRFQQRMLEQRQYDASLLEGSKAYAANLLAEEIARNKAIEEAGRFRDASVTARDLFDPEIIKGFGTSGKLLDAVSMANRQRAEGAAFANTGKQLPMVSGESQEPIAPLEAGGPGLEGVGSGTVKPLYPVGSQQDTGWRLAMRAKDAANFTANEALLQSKSQQEQNLKITQSFNEAAIRRTYSSLFNMEARAGDSPEAIQNKITAFFLKKSNDELEKKKDEDIGIEFTQLGGPNDIAFPAKRREWIASHKAGNATRDAIIQSQGIESTKVVSNLVERHGGALSPEDGGNLLWKPNGAINFENSGRMVQHLRVIRVKVERGAPGSYTIDGEDGAPVAYEDRVAWTPKDPKWVGEIKTVEDFMASRGKGKPPGLPAVPPPLKKDAATPQIRPPIANPSLPSRDSNAVDADANKRAETARGLARFMNEQPPPKDNEGSNRAELNRISSMFGVPPDTTPATPHIPPLLNSINGIPITRLPTPAAQGTPQSSRRAATEAVGSDSLARRMQPSPFGSGQEFDDSGMPVLPDPTRQQSGRAILPRFDFSIGIGEKQSSPTLDTVPKKSVLSRISDLAQGIEGPEGLAMSVLMEDIGKEKIEGNILDAAMSKIDKKIARIRAELKGEVDPAIGVPKMEQIETLLRIQQRIAEGKSKRK